MLGKSHLMFGAVTAATTIAILNQYTSVISSEDTAAWLFCGALVGSLLPDIDLPTSTLGKRIKPISTFLNNTIGHRTWTHDILLMVVLCILSYHYAPLSAGIWFGVFGHLFLDGCTVNGVPFSCIGKKTVHFLPKRMRMYSNEIVSEVFTLLLCGGYGLFGYLLLYPETNIFTRA